MSRIKSSLFKTADAAAIDALKGALEKSIKKQHEYGGLIFRIGRPPRYFYMKPLQMTTEPTGGQLEPEVTPPGATVVAQMHTHPHNEDKYGKPGDLTTIEKPARFSEIDLKGQADFEKRLQRDRDGPVDMYVIDIHGEVNALERRRGSRTATVRVVRGATDLTGI